MTWTHPLKEFIITSSFGNRIHPITHDIRFHNGVDLRAKYEPLFSVGAGTIKSVYTSGPGGLTIIVEHPGGYESGFAHLDSVNVVPGQSVKAGEQIGIGPATLKDIISHLEATYCESIGIEYQYIRHPNRVKWIRERIELKNRPVLSKEEKVKEGQHDA